MSRVFDVNLKQSKNVLVKKFFKQAVQELSKFYNVNWVDNTPTILLVNERTVFDLLVGYKTEDWVVGTALSYNKLLLFSPESYEKESRHKYCEDEYYSLLKHELSHLFYAIFSQNRGPVWLDEGFAIYTSGQLNTKEKPKEFNSFIQYYSCGGEGVYAEAGFVVAGLIEKYGKEKVVNFLKLLSDVKSEKDFKIAFETFFKMKFDYKDFQELL